METRVINNLGHLTLGGIDSVELVKKYGTPLYVMDENVIRQNCRDFLAALKDYPDSLVCYASKAFSCKAIYQIIDGEGLGTDVVSIGELYTAVAAGFDMSKVIFHGNNKLEDEIAYAINCKVKYIVVDGADDAEFVNSVSAKNDAVTEVLIRVNTGIDAHTHDFVKTSLPDSKFGVAIENGALLETVEKIVASKNLRFVGLHSHLGSQILEVAPYLEAVDKLTDFIAMLQKKKISVEVLNLGGGFGIKYTESDKTFSPEDFIPEIVQKLKSCILNKNITAPKLILEPGRYIVGKAGTTLYKIGAIKDIKGIRKYLSVDGGMFDNPRYALYRAKYSAVLANRANIPNTEKVTVAGKCCESGDIIISDIDLPKAERGDIIAVEATGAYNYSMASNYNRNFIPPVVLVGGGKSQFIVRPQTLVDIIARDADLKK